MQPETQRITPLRQRLVVGALMFLLLLLLGITSARAGEIVPSVGLSHSSESGENQSFFGLEVRGSLAPMLKAGLGVGYRSEEMSNGDLTMRIIPVTASLWVSPVPTLYAGGGVGAYFETLTYRDALLVPNSSETTLGAHVGGGFSIPAAPMLSIELQGRYVFLEPQTNAFSTQEFDPDFWNVSAGVAIKF